MFLERSVTEATLRTVQKCGKGSIIAFDYLAADLIRTRTLGGLLQKVGEPWLFGLEPEEYLAFVGDRGLAVLEHLQALTLRERYLPKRATSECAGFLEDFGGFVVAGSQ